MTATEISVICAALCMLECGTPSSPRAGELAAVTGDGVPATLAAAPGAHAAARQPPAPTSQTRSTTASASAFHPDDDLACSGLATLASEVHLWQVAASPQPHRRKAAALWPTLPAACRGGTFYVAAAELVGHATDAALATADGAVVVHSAGDALARGLAAEPDHPRLLAHLAFAADVSPDAKPALPAGACASARGRGDAWGDDAAYVCALAAIHASDGPTALAELDRIRTAAAFPDLLVRRAQALALAGKAPEAAALKKRALDALDKAPPRFDLTPPTIAALKKKLPVH
jgi:hypothetical protein